MASLLAGRSDVISLPLQNPSIRIAYEKKPGSLIDLIESKRSHQTVFIDEVQKVPELLDAAQYLIDEKKANFILTGSSARKLRKAGANWLPGRVKLFHMDPLLWGEMGWSKSHYCKELSMPDFGKESGSSYMDALIYGTLPGIPASGRDVDAGDYLRSYATLYLEEEIRAEAATRKVAEFSNFLELAAHESGTSPNLSKLSMEVGVSVPTVKEYYTILEDTLVAERVEPYLKNARKRMLATPRYYFFDIGVRNAMASMPMDPQASQANKGQLFEHFVMLEIIRRVRAMRKNWKVRFWRTAGGAEVDCVVDMGTKVIPIEIKSSQSVRKADLKGLVNFLAEYPEASNTGYVITQGRNTERVAENIVAVPWDQF